MPRPQPSLPSLYCAQALREKLWQHARACAPQECVGLLGGTKRGAVWEVQRVCPVPNIAPQPLTEYRAQPQATLKALREFAAQGLTLVGLYHSHPRGPAHYSAQDQAQAGYDVPYLIADLSTGKLLAYWLPSGTECVLLEG